MIKTLRPSNESSFFQGSFSKFEACRYSPEYLWEDIKKIATRNNVEIEYITYKRHVHLRRLMGSFAFIIKGCIPQKLEQNDKDPIFFDPEQLWSVGSRW